MHRRALALGTLVGIVGAAAIAIVGEQRAAACGGCFQPPPPPNQTTSDITDERMLLATSPTQTTLYDQIQYSGSPASFAWVLPIHGTVNVGLSADVLFDSVDVLTATDVVSPPPSCPPPPTCGRGGASLSNGAAAPAPSGMGGGSDGTVTVTKQQNVGPYATVQLQSTSPTALEDWLSQNSFDIPAAVKPVIAQYVNEGFNFLAMKLLPGQGVSAMRPVRVTSPGASLSLPLRMAAIGTGATVGITIWVVADGRYEPQNFPFFRIDDSEIVWDWSTSSSNYTTLRTQHEATLNGKGWEQESSITLAQQTISGVIQSGGVYYGNPNQGGPGGGPGGGVAPAADASQDYLPVTDANGTVTETADQVRTDDITALFAGISGPNARVSRMRSDISHAAMTVDFVLQASADQTEQSNVRNVTKSINEQCPIYGSDCSVIGYGTPGQATAAAGGGGGGGSSGGSSTFACNAAPEPLGGTVGLGAGAALLGLVVVRLRRRRAR